MEKLLLLGGFSFVGKNLIPLLKGKYEIVVLNRTDDPLYRKRHPYFTYYPYDFSKNKSLKEIIEKEQPDYVINLISVVTADRSLLLFPSILESNLNTVLKIYESLKSNTKLRLFINFGSAEEYGNIEAPFSEERKEQPNSPYSIVKLMISNLAMLLYENHQFPITVIRPSNLFGKYQKEEKFIPYIVNKLKNNEEVDTTLGEQKRDFLDVETFCLLIIELLNKSDIIKGEIINIGSGKSIALKKILETLKEKLDSNSIINYGKLPYRENEIMDFRSDITKLESILGRSLDYDIELALKNYIKE